MLSSISISETGHEPLSMTSASTVLQGAAVFSIVFAALLGILIFANLLRLVDSGED
jgi:hypothetical protein